MNKSKFFVLFVAVAALAAGLYWWWQHEATYPSTDDAYLNAKIFTIAPQISGRVANVNVSENQRIEGGDVLFRIDDALLKQT